MGFPIDYNAVKTMTFYPVGLRALSLLAIRKVFNFTDEEVREMGAAAPKVSFIIKLFVQHFYSVARIVAKTCELWEKHYTAGQLTAESSEENRNATLRLSGLALHSLFCLHLEGYFSTVLRMVVKSKVTAKESKCACRGDEYHEFILTW